jgi:FtsZ-binding cell division protein ZapB
MEEEIQKIMASAIEFVDLVSSYRVVLAHGTVSPEVSEALKRFDQYMTDTYNKYKSGNFEDIPKLAISAANCGIVVGEQPPPNRDDESLQDIRRNLILKAHELRSFASEGFAILASQEGKNAVNSLADMHKQFESLADEHINHDGRIKKLLNENELRIAGLEQSLKGLEEAAQSEIDKITLTYINGLEEIKEKKTQIDDILGVVSGRAIAGDYEKSAAEEKKMADSLRFWSLVCMVVIAGCLIYTLLGHSTDWQQSLFRVTLTFLLSVPAAYLARESAKHREQQYQHLQTSLDLKALSPFVASLPDEEQHKIKIAIASKIFAGRDFSKVGADPFPINTQEIIMELLKKVDVSKTKPQKTSE